MPDPTELPASPLHALCVYAEPLVVGRRVVVLGDATRRLGERFLELGARVVHVYDPEPARALAAAANAPRGLTVLPLPASDFDVRDGAFDLAVILDISEIPAPAPVLARLRRLLSPTGAVLVRARSGDGRTGRHARGGTLDYYELFELVALQFAHVRMVGEIPWSGVALAQLGETSEEPEVSVDTQLVTEADPPEAFIALGSQHGVELAEYAIVQVPRASTPDVEATIAYGSDRADLAAAQLRASLLEAQIEELRSARNREAVAHSEALSGLEGELTQRRTAVRGAEERVSEAALAVEQARSEARAAADELARARDRAAVWARELDEERRARGRLEKELAVARQQLEAVGRDATMLSQAVSQVPALEAAFAELQASAREQSRRLANVDAERGALETALAEASIEIETLRARESLAGERAADESQRAEVADAVEELAVQVVALEAEALVLNEGHGDELMALEAGLRDRAKAIHLLEQELLRRERIILDLIHEVEELRTEMSIAQGGNETAGAGVNAGEALRASREHEDALREARQRFDRARAENTDLRAKLDQAALEIARREAEGTTSAWRIQELEQTIARLEDEQSELTMTIPPPAFVKVEREANDVTVLASRLSALEDELDLVRQALAQEHEARARAESGEALTQARTELARQAALLETLSRELEARDGVRRPLAADDATRAG
jgi:hypothetical protein